MARVHNDTYSSFAGHAKRVIKWIAIVEPEANITKMVIKVKNYPFAHYFLN